MKTQIISALLLAVALAQTAHALDIKTRKGRILRDCIVRELTEDGVRIFYAEGITTVDFRDIPPELQQQLHYDAEKGRKDYKAAAGEAYQWYLGAAREAERQNAARLAADRAKQAEDARLRSETDLERREQEAQRKEVELQRRAAALADQERKLQQDAPSATSPEQQQPPDQQQTLTLEQMQQMVDIWAKLQQMNNAEDQKSLDMIQQLQALKAGRSRSRVKQTPAEANAWWQQYQQQQKLSQMQAELERLRQQQRR